MRQGAPLRYLERLSMLSSESPRLKVYCCTVLLLLVFWARAITNLHGQSLTVDEPVHLVRGLAYWRTGDLRLQYGHPPLSHALVGLFAALEPDVPSPARMSGWTESRRLDIAEQLVWETPSAQLDRLFFLGRWPMLALGLLLASVSFRWAMDLFGPLAGLLALLLSTFDPNLLAHTTLATTDLCVTFMIFATSYAFFRWVRCATREHLVGAGVALGLALGAKLSSLILIPVLGLVVLGRAQRQEGQLTRGLLALVSLLGVSACVLWAIYRFETGFLGGFPIPVPTHWENLRRLWLHQSAGHRAYFLGQLSQRGWWYYFPVLFLIKTPVPVLLLLMPAAIALLRGRRASVPAVAYLFPLFYFIASMVSNINIGYRHILPVVPFLVLIASAAGRQGDSQVPALRIVSGGLILWLTASSLSIHPYYLTYFNEIVGGPGEGYRYAVDSNFDWGQDLKRLAAHVDETEVTDLKLSYFGNDRPDRYLHHFEELPDDPFAEEASGFHPLNPGPGTYAISASHLQGLALGDADSFDWFRRRDAVARVGSILVYEVEPIPTSASWVALGFDPASPLSPDGLATGVGRVDLRRVYFDCRSSWVYPAGKGSGWYILPGLGDPHTPAARMMVDDGEVVFQGRPTGSRGALTVYLWETPVGVDGWLDDLADQAKAVRFGDLLTFRGSEREIVHNSPMQEAEVILTTYWEVVGQSDEPVSIMAHLVDEHDNVVDVADGLGVPVENWKEGDVLVQEHRFAVPGDTLPCLCVPRVGVYVLSTMELVGLADGSGDTLRLTPVDLRHRD